MNNEEVRKKIGQFFQSTGFAFECANVGKSGDKLLKLEEWQKIAMSLPRLYAVVEAAEIALLAFGLDSLDEALGLIASGQDSRVNDTANRCARLAWQAQQPLLAQERIARPIMGCTSGNLPEGELVKDEVRVQATAAFLIQKLAE